MISFIVPTIGRSSLRQTLASIELQPGDEIIVVGNIDRQPDLRAKYIPAQQGNDWGGSERRLGMTAARGKYLAFIDDDDVYVPGARDVMAAVVAEVPDRPIVFRMRYPNGFVLWLEPVMRCGNIGTPMTLMPNDAKLGTWTGRRECDFDFLQSSGWAPDDYAWATDVIVSLGHNDVGMQ